VCVRWDALKPHCVRTLRMHAVINSQNLFMRENNNYHILLHACCMSVCACCVKSSRLAACTPREIYFDPSAVMAMKILSQTSTADLRAVLPAFLWLMSLEMFGKNFCAIACKIKSNARRDRVINNIHRPWFALCAVKDL